MKGTPKPLPRWHSNIDSITDRLGEHWLWLKELFALPKQKRSGRGKSIRRARTELERRIARGDRQRHINRADTRLRSRISAYQGREDGW